MGVGVVIRRGLSRVGWGLANRHSVVLTPLGGVLLWGRSRSGGAAIAEKAGHDVGKLRERMVRFKEC